MQFFSRELLITILLCAAFVFPVGGGVFSIALPVYYAIVYFFILLITPGMVYGNPAAIIGAYFLKVISPIQLWIGLLAQGIGALILYGIYQWYFDPVVQVLPSVYGAELWGAVFLGIGLSALQQHTYRYLIPLSLLIGMAFSATLGGAGIINPAIALGLGNFSLTYTIIPVVGVLIGIIIHKKVLHESYHKN